MKIERVKTTSRENGNNWSTKRIEEQQYAEHDR